VKVGGALRAALLTQKVHRPPTGTVEGNFPFMQIFFRCRHCFAECKANPTHGKGPVLCKACGRQQTLNYSESHRTRNIVDRCVVCKGEDFYIRDEARKALGLVYLLAGLSAAYFTYGVSLALGGWGFYWYFWKYPKLTVCYNCYAKYRNCRLNPHHKEYDLEFVAHLEREIRNDRTLRDFR